MTSQQDFLANIPGLVIIKDINSIFLGMSENCAKILGWKSAETCLGKTDFDIPSNANKFANEFIKMDQQTITSGKPFLSLEIVPQLDSSINLFLVERLPFQNNKSNKNGVYLHCNNLTNTHLFNSFIALHQFDKKIVGHNFKPACYILNNDHCSLPLTNKQQNCLFLLIRGKSIKQIAKFFQVSPRTIEEHIVAIGKKLGCTSKAEIIERAIDSGYLYYVPNFFQQKKLENLF